MIFHLSPKKCPILGRHACRCQARKHELVSNCLNCGKVVCQQEGSGPCFFCGSLVCTAEEKEILDRGSKKSAELYEKLMGRPFEGAKVGIFLYLFKFGNLGPFTLRVGPRFTKSDGI